MNNKLFLSLAIVILVSARLCFAEDAGNHWGSTIDPCSLGKSLRQEWCAPPEIWTGMFGEER
jgi:hypothetical protein